MTGRVKGVATGDMGVARDGEHKADYTPGLELHAKYTLFGEGVRGGLSKELMRIFDLRAGVEPQVFGLGIKELWDIDPAKHSQGRVIHTQGWPLAETEGSNGGGWLYHQANGQVSLGFVTWLNYSNPYLSPFEEMQRWKTHPAIAAILEGGKRVSYGARAINDGGLQSIPKLTFPGGALIGCSAGFLNVPRLKGTHGAMKSGMMAAEAAFAAVQAGREHDELTAYPEAFDQSWLKKELSVVRNVVPLVKKYRRPDGFRSVGGHDVGRALGYEDALHLGHKPDHESLWRKDLVKKIDYPKPDGVLTFDRLSSVFLSNTNHAEDQPVPSDAEGPRRPRPRTTCRCMTARRSVTAPRACTNMSGSRRAIPSFVINAQNCVHCKTCDIKDPTQNINWVVPEGGGGPNYPNM